MVARTIAELKTLMAPGVEGNISGAKIQDFIDTLAEMTTQEVITVTGSHTATLANNRRRIVFNNAAAATLTIPNNMPVGWEIFIKRVGAGTVTVVAATGGAIRHDEGHTKLAKQYSEGIVWVYANTGTAAQIGFSGSTAL